MYFVFGVPIFTVPLCNNCLCKKKNYDSLFRIYSPDYFRFHACLQPSDLAASAFEMDKMTPHALSKMIGYPVYLIWLPIFISGCLVLLNIYRGVRRIFLLRKAK